MEGDPEDNYFDVLAMMYSGGAWHDQTMEPTGPAVKFVATRETLRRFLLDLLTEPNDPAVCELQARQISASGFQGFARCEAERRG